MKFKLKPITLRCNLCFCHFEKKNDDFEYTQEIVDNRSMGNEVLHSWVISYQDYPKCGKKYFVSIDQYEYPEGCLNWKETQTDRVSITNEVEVEED